MGLHCYSVKMRLLERDFHILIRNVSFSSPTNEEFVEAKIHAIVHEEGKESYHVKTLVPTSYFYIIAG